eukprot:292199-Pyramimonas_sp.AAC.1
MSRTPCDAKVQLSSMDSSSSSQSVRFTNFPAPCWRVISWYCHADPREPAREAGPWRCPVRGPVS